MAEAAAAPKLKKSVTDWSKSTLLRNLRLINMCNGILLILAGIVCCIVAAVNVSISTITLACFTCFFGTLMACLECNIGNCESSMTFSLYCEAVTSPFAVSLAELHSLTPLLDLRPRLRRDDCPPLPMQSPRN